MNKVTLYEKRRSIAASIAVLFEAQHSEHATMCRDVLDTLPERIEQKDKYVVGFHKLGGLIQLCLEIARRDKLHDIEQFIAQQTNMRNSNKLMH